MTTPEQWSLTTLDRLMAKVRHEGDCWIFTGGLDRGGYGDIYTGPRRSQRQRAHRVAYLLLVGPIPDGLVLDHLCRNRACVNPEHLEPVTIAENNARGIGPLLAENGETCRNGLHPWPESAQARSDGWLRCGPCQQATDRRYKERQASA